MTNPKQVIPSLKSKKFNNTISVKFDPALKLAEYTKFKFKM
jgi:hypothetical protein